MFGIFFVHSLREHKHSQANGERKKIFKKFLLCGRRDAKLPAPAPRASRAKPTTPGPIAAAVINWKFNLKH